MRVSVACLTLSVAAALDLTAQQPTIPAPLFRTLTSADSATRLRIRTHNGVQVEDPLVRFDSSYVALGTADTVALAEVEHLWQRGTAWRKGGAVGAIVGAASGASLGYLAVTFQDYYRSENLIYVAGSAVGGATVGFALGAGIGFLVPKWRTRYP